MAASNFSLTKFGLTEDVTATGLFVGDINYDFKVDKVDVKNHIGTTVGFTLSDDQISIKCSGVITTKTAGMTPALASVISFANTSAHSLTLTTKHTFSTAVANAGTVVIGMSLKRVNSEHETGDIDTIYHPGVTTNAPVSVT
jgi:hypothetical protein